MKSHIAPHYVIMTCKDFTEFAKMEFKRYADDMAGTDYAYKAASKAAGECKTEFSNQLQATFTCDRFGELSLACIACLSLVVALPTSVEMEDGVITTKSVDKLEEFATWLSQIAADNNMGKQVPRDETEPSLDVLSSVLFHHTIFGASVFCLLYPYLASMSDVDIRWLSSSIGRMYYLLLRIGTINSPASRVTVASLVSSSAAVKPTYKGSQFHKGFCKQLRVISAHDKPFEAHCKIDELTNEGFNYMSPYDLPRSWLDMTNKQKALLLTADNSLSTKEINNIVRRADKVYCNFIEGWFIGTTVADGDLMSLTLAHDKQMHERGLIMSQHMCRNTESQYKELQASYDKKTAQLNSTISTLKQQLKDSKQTPVKEVVKVEKVEVSKAADADEIKRLKTLVAKQQEHIQVLEGARGSSREQTATVERLQKQLENLERSIGVAEDTPSAEDTKRLTHEELATLSRLKPHISMPDCKAVNEIRRIIPRAKIETAPLGKHGNISLTPGYDTYLFCTKLSHAHFASWYNQIKAHDYDMCFSNTASAITICRVILEACQKGD